LHCICPLMTQSGHWLTAQRPISGPSAPKILYRWHGIAWQMASRSGNVRVAQLHIGSGSRWRAERCAWWRSAQLRNSPQHASCCTGSFLQPLLAVNCCAGPDNHLELSALSASSTVTKCPRWRVAGREGFSCALVEQPSAMQTRRDELKVNSLQGAPRSCPPACVAQHI
jgi:hypothetical protein